MKTLWEVSSDVESLGCRISNIKDMVEMIAVGVSTEPESGALWAVRDYLEIIAEKLDDQVHEIMDIHIRVKEDVPLKKGKSK